MSRDGLRLAGTVPRILRGPLVPAFGKNLEGHVPDPQGDPGPAGEAMLWAPLVGLVLGVIAAAVLYVFSQLLHTGSLVAAVLAVGTLAVATRGLHLDGLADLA